MTDALSREEALAIRKALTGGKAERGLSQSEMAPLLEAQVREVQRWESGERNVPPRVAKLYRLAREHGADLLRSV